MRYDSVYNNIEWSFCCHRINEKGGDYRKFGTEFAVKKKFDLKQPNLTPKIKFNQFTPLFKSLGDTSPYFR